MTMIHPGTYIHFSEDIPSIQEVNGTVGFIPFLSERYIDNSLIFTGSLNLDLFGKANKMKYTQGLYNAQNFHEVSTWLYVMRVLPTVEDMIEPIYDGDGKIIANEKYLHPFAGKDVAWVDSVTSDTPPGISVPATKILPAPTFAHTTFGYVYSTDSDSGEISAVGGLQRYKNPLYGVSNNRENLLYLDEGFGDVTRLKAVSILTDENELKYNSERETYTDNIPSALSSWVDLNVGSAGSGGITDPANGFTDKYWPEFTVPGSYYENFSPMPNSFTPLFAIYGIGRGDWYNRLQISLVPKLSTKGVYDFAVLTVNPKTNTLQQLGATLEVSFDPDSVDQFGDSNYIGNLVNTLSDYVRIHVFADNMEAARTLPAPNDTTKTIFEKVTEFLYSYDPSVDLEAQSRINLELRNGSLGGLYINGRRDTNTYNNAMISCMQGDYDGDVKNIYANDISIIFDNDTTVEYKEAIQELCGIRQDCFGYIDLPKVPTPNSAIEERSDALNNIQQWYVGIFGNHSLIYSADEGRDIWVSPSYHLSYLVPTVDLKGHLWDATAGFKRGVLKTSKKLQYNLNDTDYSRWYLNQINPIMEKMNIIHVGGQLTAQKYLGPKQNINIARMVLYVGKTLRKFGEWFIFDLITIETLSNIESEIKQFLKQIKIQNGILDYKATVSSSPYEMKRKIATANVELSPTYVLEKLLFNISLTQ